MQIEKDHLIKKDGKWVRRDNKNLKPRKKICYAKEACISERPNYGNLLFPVCPVLRDILIDKPLYDISKIETTNSPLLDSVNRVRFILRELTKLIPNEQTIVRCAHTKDSYNRNFLTEWLKPIEDDLKTLPEKMQDNFPATSEKLAKLIKELKTVVDSYTIYSRTGLFLQFPLYLFGKDDYGFSVWRSELTSSKPYGIVDEGGSNKEPDALVCASKTALACTYPIDAIEASRPICEELEEVAKHLDREKIASSKAVVNVMPQGKAGQGKPTKITKAEANVRVRQLLKETPTWDWSTRELANQVHCGHVLISETPAYIAYHEKRKELRRNKTIDTVSLSDELEAVLGEGEKDEVLKQLIAEQEGDQREDAQRAKLYLSRQKKPKRSSQ